MESPRIKMQMINGEMWAFFRLKDGDVKVCKGYNEIKAFMKKIDRKEVEIIDFEE